MALKGSAKKACDTATTVVVTAAPIVSQTQESPVIPDSPTNLSIVAHIGTTTVLDGLSTADNTAIAEMASRCMNEDNDNDSAWKGMWCIYYYNDDLQQ